MSRQRSDAPAYRYHISGQARVTLGGKDFFLGEHDSPESKAKYFALLAEYNANGKKPPETTPAQLADAPITVGCVTAEIREHIKVKYANSESHRRNCQNLCTLLEDEYGDLPAVDFGPRRLASLRDLFVASGNNRKYANSQVRSVQKIFKHAVSRELIDVNVTIRLETLEPLRFGQTTARESVPREPVDLEVVRKTVRELPPTVAAMIRVQAVTGMRPSEVCKIRPCDIDQSNNDAWVYRPEQHKTAHHGKRKASLAMQPLTQIGIVTANTEGLLRSHEQAGSFLEEETQDEKSKAGTRAAGDCIGPYKLRELIGEGGMGSVYVAEQYKPVKRKVALKVIKPGMDTKEVVARFEAERQALAMMDHPSIAKVFDAGMTDNGRPYFVMELINGVPLTEYCDHNKLGIRQRLGLFVSVCKAVQHAHQKGVIHRDLKPSNVLVTLHDGEPVPVIIDFGVAKVTNQNLTEHTIYTRLNQVVGTTLYMSPEQAELSRYGVDTRTDVYSLGVLLYELLTGTTPFDRERLSTAAFDEVRRIIREEEPPKPSTRISGLGETATDVSSHRDTEPGKLSNTIRGDLDWIVMKGLEKDRDRRYESATRFADDVENHLNDRVVDARPPSTVYQLKKGYQRHRVLLSTLASIVMALAIGLGFAVWAYRGR